MQATRQFKVTVESRPGFLAAGLKIRTDNKKGEIPALWEQFALRMTEIRHHTGEHVSYGVVRNYNPATGRFDYLAAVPVTTPFDLPPDMVVWEVQQRCYARIDCLLPEIHAAHDFFHTVWLPDSGFIPATGAELELYDGRFQPALGKPLLSLLIPVQRRPEPQPA